jgi:hypothetical protein
LRHSPPVVYLLIVSAASRQLSAAGTTGTKQQYGGCNPHEVKVYGGYGPNEVNVLRVPPACCKSTAGATCSKLRLVLVKPAGETDFLRGALEPHTQFLPGKHTNILPAVASCMRGALEPRPTRRVRRGRAARARATQLLDIGAGAPAASSRHERCPLMTFNRPTECPGSPKRSLRALRPRASSSSPPRSTRPSAGLITQLGVPRGPMGPLCTPV